MSSAEAMAAAVTSWLALSALAAYALDTLGLGVQPWAAGPIALLVAGTWAALTPRRAERQWADLAVWLGLVVFVASHLLRLSWPALLPPGRGPDLTHHLLLVDYIEHTGHLVHDRALTAAMGEMAAYTPGTHLLAVMAGQWFGTDGLRTFYPLVALSAALTAGFVFLIARRLLLPLPYGIAAVLLLYLPAQYLFGGFTHDSYYAQAVSTLFAVAMWWALVWWNEQPLPGTAVIVGVFLIGIFLTWPIWLGPLLLVFLAFLLRVDLPRRDRLQHLAIVLGPFALVALVHAVGRWGWVGMVSTSGAVLHPTLASMGWLFPLLAIAGVIAGATDRRTHVTIALLLVIALQGVTLWIVAESQGADTPYMALKMVYLAIYPMAILAIFAIAIAARSHEIAGWLAATVLIFAVVRPALVVPRTVAVIELDFQAAGKWVRANSAAACTDYLVGDAETAYWLHLAVLGNSRSSERMKEMDVYEPRAAVGPWITGEGRAFAIADLRILPDEVRSRVELITQFGHAGVIKRPGATMEGCD